MEQGKTLKITAKLNTRQFQFPKLFKQSAKHDSHQHFRQYINLIIHLSINGKRQHLKKILLKAFEAFLPSSILDKSYTLFRRKARYVNKEWM